MGIKILLCHRNGNRSLSVGFLEECCDGNVGGKGCLLSPGRIPELCTKECQIPEVNSHPTWAGGEEHRRRREESIQRDLHKPSHLSLGNNVSKCFSNGMVYNNAQLRTRHANQHQKNQFFNKGCQGHIALLNTLREKIPFQIPPLVSICLQLIGVLVLAQS